MSGQGRFEAYSGTRRLAPMALCGLLLAFGDSANGQQATARPLLDAPLSSLLSAYHASKLTGDARRTFDVLTLIIEDADKATTADGRNGYLQEFLLKSQDFVREQPSALPVWTLRAVAALEANQAPAGQEACERMIGLKAGESDDPRVRRVLAMLDRRGWFKAIAADAAGVGTQPAKPATEDVRAKPAAIQGEQNSISPVEHDAKWSASDAYLHRMIEAIQSKWDRIVDDGKIMPPPGSYVAVRLTMDWRGNITEILDVKSTSGEEGRQSCVTAINMAAPYGEWTDHMMATLGGSQQLTLRFNFGPSPATNPNGPNP